MYDHVDEEDKREIDPQSEQFQGSCGNETTLESNPHIRRMMLINESGLYAAIFGCKLPEAKKFKRWITSEVLPTIRRTGKYDPADTLNKSTQPPLSYTKEIEFVAKNGTYPDFCKKLNPALLAISQHFGFGNTRTSLKFIYYVYEFKHGYSIGELQTAKVQNLLEKGDVDRADIFAEAVALKVVYLLPRLRARILQIVNETIELYGLKDRVEKFNIGLYTDKRLEDITNVNVIED